MFSYLLPNYVDLMLYEEYIRVVEKFSYCRVFYIWKWNSWKNYTWMMTSFYWTLKSSLKSVDINCFLTVSKPPQTEMEKYRVLVMYSNTSQNLTMDENLHSPQEEDTGPSQVRHSSYIMFILRSGTYVPKLLNFIINYTYRSPRSEKSL